MTTVKMYDLERKRILVTRQSARGIEPILCAAMVEGQGQIALDFSGVDGVTPSFLDETLAVIQKCIQTTQGKEFRLLVVHPPTRLSAKFAAVGRARGLSISESESGTWIITGERLPKEPGC